MLFVYMQSSDNTTRLGTAMLNMWGVFDDKNWYWIGIGGLFGFAVLFNGLFTLALSYLDRKFPFLVLLPAQAHKDTNYIYIYIITTALGKPQAILPKEEDESKSKYSSVYTKTYL